MLESSGHAARAQHVRATFGGKGLDLVTVLLADQRQESCVAVNKRAILFDVDEFGAIDEHLMELLLNRGLVAVVWEHRDGNRVVRCKLKLRLDDDVRGELERLAAHDKVGVLDGRHERRVHAMFVDGHGNKGIDSLLVHQHVEVADTHLLGRRLCEGFLGIHANTHSLAEVDLGNFERTIDFLFGCRDLKGHRLLVFCKLNYLH